MDSKQIENIKSKIEVGDFITLSKVLNLKRSTAVSRFNRNDQKTVLVMEKIISEKNTLVDKIKRYASDL